MLSPLARRSSRPLTYYAYLAWLVFAALLVFLLLRWPVMGTVWLVVLVVRMLNFARLRSRSPVELARAHEKAQELELAGGEGAGDALEAMGPPSKGPSGGGLGRVLLVGNGPSMKERGMGSVVDSFDTVVRFNSFVTKGMEEHTGSKVRRRGGRPAATPLRTRRVSARPTPRPARRGPLETPRPIAHALVTHPLPTRAVPPALVTCRTGAGHACRVIGPLPPHGLAPRCRRRRRSGARDIPLHTGTCHCIITVHAVTCRRRRHPGAT